MREERTWHPGDFLGRADAEVQKMLSGREYDIDVIDSSDLVTRQLVAEQLLNALASRDYEYSGLARRAFMDHGYFDEVTRDLRIADSSDERALAAQKLGLIVDPLSTAHLIAALYDGSPDVRRAAVESLSLVGETSAVSELKDLLHRETSEQVPEALIRQAIDSITTESALMRDDETVRPETEIEQSAQVESHIDPEKEAGRLAEDESSIQQLMEESRIRAEREARIQAEEEARRRAEDEARFRVEAETLRRAAEELARKREAAEIARKLAEQEAQRRAEAEAALVAQEKARQREIARAREEQVALRHAEEEESRRNNEQRLRDLEQRRQIEEQRLVSEKEALIKAASELVRRRGEVEQARKKAEKEIQILKMVQERIRVEEEERGRIIEQKQKIEDELRQRTEEEHQRLLEARLRVEQERQLEEFAQGEAEKHHRRFEELLGIKRKAEEDAVQRAEQETRIRQEIEALVKAEAEQRERIGIETRRRDAAEARLHEQESRRFDDVQSSSIPEHGKSEADSIEHVSMISIDAMNALSSDLPAQRAAALSEIATVGGDEAFYCISKAFDDPSPEVRNAAARALFSLQTDRTASYTRALRDGLPDRCRRIGSAIAQSGLAGELINNLTAESRETTYDAFSLLFLMAKAGEVEPLIQSIEEHPNIEARLAVVKLLALSDQSEIVTAFRRLAVRGTLPSEVRSAVMEAIYQISETHDSASSAA